MKEAVRDYRATSFGKPVGPWRSSRDEMRDDLVALDLGSYDEWGKFYVTVPGDYETRWRIVPIAEAA